MLKPYPSALICAIWLCLSCGTNTGNPLGPTPDEEDEVENAYVPGEDTTTVTNSIEGQDIDIPTFSLTIPENLTEDDGSEQPTLSLTSSLGLFNNKERGIIGKAEKCSNLLTCSLGSMYRSLKGVDKITSRLKGTDEVKRGGKFRQKGPNKSLSGITVEIVDAKYRYQLEVCSNSEPLLLLRWDEAKNNIMFIRDHKKAPLAGIQKRNALVKVVLSRQESKESYEVSTLGENPKPDDRINDGDVKREFTVLEKDLKDSSFTIKSVGDWHKQGETSSIADSYLSGVMDSEGVGGYFGYRQALNQVCKEGFDENAQDLWVIDRNKPGFCFARSSKTRQILTKSEAAALGQQLKEVGIVKAQKLKDFRIQFTRKCD